MSFLAVLSLWFFEPSTWLALLLALATVYFLNFWQKVRQLPPGPSALPFIGNLLQLRAPKPLYIKAIEWTKTYGDPFTVWIGPAAVVIANTNNSFKEISGPLRNTLAGRMNSKQGDMFARGNTDVAFSDFNPAWDVLRRLVHVAIRQYAKTDKLAYLVAEQADFELDEIFQGKSEATSGAVDYVEEVVNNVIAKSNFGEGFQKSDQNYKKLRHAIKYFEEEGANGFPSDIHPLLRFIYYRIEKDLEEAIKTFHIVTDALFDQAKNTWTSGSKRHFTDALLNSREKFLEEDRSSAKYLTDNNLSQAIFDIFVAGSSTSKAVLGFSVLYLANYPDLQEELREEVINEIGTNICLSDDRTKLPKLDAFLQEIIRLNPAVPFALPRKTLENVTLNGYFLPKGTNVFTNLYAVNRDTSIWGPDADKFKPSRFLDATKDQIAKGANSFGVGARSCPGEKMAQADMLYALVRILQKVRLTASNGPESLDLDSVGADILHDPKRQEIIFTKI